MARQFTDIVCNLSTALSRLMSLTLFFLDKVMGFFLDKVMGSAEIWHPAAGITTVFKAGILAQVVLILKPELAPWQPNDA